MKLQVPSKTALGRSCDIFKDIEAPTRVKAVMTTQRFKPTLMGCMHVCTKHCIPTAPTSHLGDTGEPARSLTACFCLPPRL